MTLDWFAYSIAATVFLGTAMAFYKLPSFKRHSPFISTFWANVVATLCVIIVFSHDLFVMGAWKIISLTGIVWGALFASTMLLQKIALKKVETNVLLPLTSSLGSVMTIGVGIVFLSERPSILQLLGTGIILLSLSFFTIKKQSFSLTRNVAVLSLGIIALSTLSKYVQKFGATHEVFAAFLVWQYIGALLFALALFLVSERKPLTELFDKKYLAGASIIGMFTFLGGWMIVKALAYGPLSGVYAIHPTYILVTAAIAALLFQERLTKQKIILIALCILGTIFIKVG